MSYATYLKNLMALWQNWAQSRYMRKYLYVSLGLVAVLGILISIIPYMHFVGIPVAFLLISGYDWQRQRRAYNRAHVHAPTVYSQAERDEDERNDYFNSEEEEDESDYNHPEEFDDLEATDEITLDDLRGAMNHMQDDETHN